MGGGDCFLRREMLLYGLVMMFILILGYLFVCDVELILVLLLKLI